jgi:hypothetical protein
MDGNKENNTYLENIEWCTPKQNNWHKENILGKHRRGERCHLHKLTKQGVREIRVLLKEGKITQKQIAELYNVHSETVSKIKLGKRWSSIK